MEFFLTDIALGLTAIIALLAYETLLGSGQSTANAVPATARGRRNGTPERIGKVGASRSKPRPKSQPPVDLIVMDPRRLARLW